MSYCEACLIKFRRLLSEVYDIEDALRRRVLKDRILKAIKQIKKHVRDLAFDCRVSPEGVKEISSHLDELYRVIDRWYEDILEGEPSTVGTFNWVMRDLANSIRKHVWNETLSILCFTRIGRYTWRDEEELAKVSREEEDKYREFLKTLFQGVE